MHRRNLLAALTLTAVPLLAAGFALAQDTPPTPPGNAAVEYWRASYSALTFTSGREGGLSPLSDIDWDAVGDNLDPAKMPEAYKAAAACVSPEVVSDFLVASRRPYCDFQNPVHQGPATLLPHLGAIRSLARIARYDARERLIAGEPDAAAERIAAIYRAADHVAGDRIMISSLVGAAMASMAHDELKTLTATRTLTEAGREELLGALKSLDTADPFNLQGAIRGEQQLMLGWVRTNFTGADAGSRFAKNVAPMLSSGQAGEAKVFEAIAMMREEQFRESLDKADRFYDDVLAAWQSDVTLARLATIESRVKSGEYGPITAVVGPSLQMAYRSSEKARAARDEAITRLEAYQPAAPR